jgi:predicted  nucleic acid-binding Zn-ribbon protein
MADVEEKDFKCLRCGAISKFPYQKGVMMERQCPKCGSNSIRFIKEKNKKRKKNNQKSIIHLLEGTIERRL